MRSEMCGSVKWALNFEFSLSDRLKKLIDERESLLDQVITRKLKCCVFTESVIRIVEIKKETKKALT